MTKSSSEKNGLKKGPWTPEEDQKLIDYIHKHGHGKWRTLPKNAGLKRCGKSCRLRWANYLRPDIKRGRFSIEEEETIIQLHSVLGNKWSTIAANLPGRTDNEIKNYWNTHIKKKLLKMGIDPVTHTPRFDVLQLASFLSSSLYNSPQLSYHNSPQFNSSQLLSLLTTLLSCQSKNHGDILNHNYQQSCNQFGGNSLLQNQNQNQTQTQCSQSMQLDSIQAFQPNLPLQSNPLNMEPQLMKTKLEHPISPIATSFSHQNTLPNLLHYNNGGHTLDLPQAQSSSPMQCFSNLPKFNSIVNNHLENQILCNNDGVMNFNLSSLLSSTPSCSTSPSTLNSSSSTTFVNGTTEDERDTYGSKMLMYNISNGLNDSGLL